MLRKSLQALFAATLLALAAVVAYATLQLSDAEATVDEAAEKIARGEYARAVAVLGFAEGRARGPLLERVRRLRYEANTKLDDSAAALIDVNLLLRDGHGDDEGLLLDRIRLLAKSRDGEGALLAAREFLERWPGHSRALELAGEACQTLYQPLLRDVNDRLERNVAQVELADARTAMLGYVYRPDGDPEVKHSFDELQQAFSNGPRLAAEWSALERDLRDVRERVQQALDFFRRSLEVHGEPVAAFQQFARALDQSRRIDDLLVACEIQRRTFDHVYVDAAGAEATWALLRDNQYTAAIATVERWIPAGGVQRRIADDRMTAATAELLLGRAFAAWRTSDAATQTRVWQDNGAMWQAKVNPAPVMALGGLFVLTSDPKEAERTLRFGIDLLIRTPLRPGRVDVLSAVMPAFLDLQLARNAGEAEVQATLTQWSKERPAAIEPTLALADFLARRGRTAAALAGLDDARGKHPGDQRIIDRRVAVMRQHVRDTDQDGPSLLAQCVNRRVALPEVRDPLGFLLCGEAALASQTWWIARACARHAIDEMPQARAPRLLQMRVAFAEKQYDDVGKHGRRLLELMAPDADTVALTLQACRAAGLPCRDVLAAAITTADDSPLLHAELLRTALADRPQVAAAFVTAAVVAPTAPAELRILAADALAHAGDHAGAARLLFELASAASTLSAADAAQLSSTIAAWVALAAPAQPDAWFAAELERLLARIGPCTGSSCRTMLAAAAELAEQRPKTASVLCMHALAGADAEDRDGRIWTLAGRLAANDREWRRRR